MSDSFTAALDREGRRLIILRPGDVFDAGVDAVIIGPGAVDLGAAGHVDRIIVEHEAAHFAGWREDDLTAFYRKAV